MPVSIRNEAGFSYGGGADGVDLTTGWTYIAITGDVANESGSENMPSYVTLTDLEIQLNTIASGATSVTMRLFRALDSSIGSKGITPASSNATASIDLQPGSTTEGDVNFPIYRDVHYRAETGASAGTLYLGLQLDAGIAKAKAYLNWRA